MNPRLLVNDLVPALLNCPCMQDRTRREDVTALLSPHLRDNIKHRDDNLSDVFNIVKTCDNYLNGLDELLQAVETFDGICIQTGKLQQEWQYIQTISDRKDPRLLNLLEIVKVAYVDDEQRFKKIFVGLRREFSAIPSMHMVPLWQVAQRLWELPRLPSRIHPIQVFVEHLAFHLETYCHQANVAENLQNWNEQHIAGFNITTEDLLARREHIQAGQDYVMTGDLIFLMVVLNPDPNNTKQNRRFKFRVYWWNASQPGTFASKSLYTEDHFVGWDEIGKELAHIVEYELPYSAEELMNLRFEFFLPVQSLSEAVDQLEYKDTYENLLKLGANYQVVVRSLERAQRPKGQPGWHTRWNKYRDCAITVIEPTISRVFELLPSDPQQLLDALQISGDVACVGLGCTSPNTEHINKILSAGLPIALWVRSREGHECLPEDAVQKVQALTQSENISQLPFLVHRERQQANTPTHPGNHLTLLWDDPTRIPADLYASPHDRFRAP